MAKVIVLCGKVASGKTTYAKMLKSKGRTVILSYDSVLLSMFDGCLGDKHDQTVERISNFFFPLAEQLISLDIDVILDYGHWRKRERDRAREYFADRGVKTELHYVITRDSLRFERLEKRNLTVPGCGEPTYIIDKELCQRLDLKFEPPSNDEIDYIFEAR